MAREVSIVVASRGRPTELDRCLTAIRQLFYRPYEVVVVADAAGRDAISAHLERPYIRAIANDADGISAARNAGIAAASGEIVAFIDDDAVPEPAWLDHLAGAFDDPAVGAATGFVRGRNGISYQWRGRTIREDGHHGRLPIVGTDAVTPDREAGAIMLEGTNMAIRRSLLESLGGFDSTYRFFLDDADIAMRVSVSGHRTAIVPLAEVHHGFAPSTRRRRDRMPTDLYDNGRSLAYFVRTYAGEGKAGLILLGHRAAERRRLLRCLTDGRCEPRDVERLLARFDEGVRAGFELGRPPPERLAMPLNQGVFRTEDRGEAPVVLSGRPWSRGRLRREARALAQSGRVVSVFRFSPTGLYHRVRFLPEGFWEQTGGLFGRSDRSGRLFRVTGFRKRLCEEVTRVAKQRGIRDTVGVTH